MVLSLIVLVLCSLRCAFGQSSSCGVDFSRADQSQYLYYTVQNIVYSDLSTVQPPLGAQFSGLTAPTSCLGYAGPLGPYGPLGMLGPIGSNTWNPSYWISGVGWDWSHYSSFLTGIGGPLSAAGPLGPNGPIGLNWYYNVCPCLSSFDHHLMNGGIFHVLGPTGPLGALGPLGPLGPIGAHGFQKDTNGNWVSNGVVQRTIQVPYDATTRRTYELYEFYDPTFAAQMPDNDCSFLVHSTLAWGAQDHYTFTSNSDQFVTVLLVPIYQLNEYDFTLTVAKPGATPVDITATASVYVDHIIVKVPAGTTMTATISGSMMQVAGEYRLYVTGSTSYINQYDVVGPYQHTL